MASRTEQKRKLREERVAREAAAAASERRRRRLIMLAATSVAALAVVGVLIAVSQSGGSRKAGLGAGEAIAGTGTAQDLFRGIPQSGATLGNPKAPATMVEFVDLQCPFCGDYTRSTLPSIIRRYVRPGKLKLEMRPVSILGEDSTTAAAAAAAAGQSNKLWQFTDLFYLNQGQERSGYVTDDFLRSIARGARVDPDAVIAASKTPTSVPLLRQAASEAQNARHQPDPDVPAGTHGRPAELAPDIELRAGPVRRRDRSSPGAVSRDRLRAAAAIAAAVGLAIAGYLTYVHYAGIEPICAASGGCERVQSSDYAKLAGVPVALIGLAGYAAILTATLLPGETARLAAAWLALVGLGFSLYLTYLELFEINAICQWCVGSAVIMAALAVLTVLRALRQGEPLPG